MKELFPYSSNQGFTLIEVIVAIILAALLGTILVQYTGANLKGSAESLIEAKSNFSAIQDMESITRDYRGWLENNPNAPLSDFQTDVVTNYPNAQTQFIALRGDDQSNSILQVTVTEGEWELLSLFTK